MRYDETAVKAYIGKYGIVKAEAFFSSFDFPKHIKKSLEGIIFRKGVFDKRAFYALVKTT